MDFRPRILNRPRITSDGYGIDTVHAAIQHISVAQRGLEVAGRVFLAMEPKGLI
jgi:hypothetical protein